MGWEQNGRRRGVTKSNEFTQSNAMKHSNPVRLLQTCSVAFPLLSHTILLFVPYQVSYKDTLKSLRLPHDATASFKLHLLLKLVAFRRTDNLSDILVRSKLRTDKQTNATKGSFRCGKNCITDRPTVVQIICFLPLGKWEPFMIVSTATLKILFRWYIVCVATNSTWVKRKDDLKTALMNTDDH